MRADQWQSEIQTTGNPPVIPSSAEVHKLDGFRTLAFIRLREVALRRLHDSGVGPDFALPRRAL